MKLMQKKFIAFFLTAMILLGSSLVVYAEDTTEDFSSWGFTDGASALTDGAYEHGNWRFEARNNGENASDNAVRTWVDATAVISITGISGVDDFRIKTVDGAEFNFGGFSFMGGNDRSMTVTGWRDGAQVTSAVNIDYRENVIDSFDMRSMHDEFTNVDEVRMVGVDIGGNNLVHGYLLSFTYDSTPAVNSYPTVSTLSPADNATNIGTDANLVITFSESVSVGTGNIVVRKTSDNSVTDTMAVTSGSVTGGDTNTITINPSVILGSATEYYVQIDEGAFKDADDHSYVGITDTTYWSFTTAANNPPTSEDGSFTTLEDTAKSGNLKATDTDPGAALTYSVVTAPSHGTVIINTDGSYTYTPAANYNGTDSFTWKANDGTADSNTATMSITVTPVNDAPTVTNFTKTGNEDTNIYFGMSDFRLKFTDADGDSMLNAKFTGLPANGTLVLGSDPITLNQEILTSQLSFVTFKPNANWNGITTFTWQGFDGTAYSADGTVTITVNPVNDAPSVINFAKAANEDTEITFAQSDFTANYTDIEGSPLAKIKITALPQHGTLTTGAGSIVLNDEVAVSDLGSLRYVPEANWNGSDSFTWQGYDGSVYSGNATVNISIAAVNDAPVAPAGSFTTDEDTAKSGSLTATDADLGASLAYSVVEGPEHGTLNLNADGSYTYTPAANFSGADSFTWKANDGTADSNTATMSITVNADVTNPTVLALSPADNATDIGVDQNLVITFSENVVKGTGSIVIRKISDNSSIENIDVESGQVTVSGSIITINPAVTLSSYTGYCVQIDATAFKDESGNYYAGIADTTAWSFTTADVSNPTVSTLSPAHNATDIGVNENLVITFSENVVVGTGSIVIRKISDNSSIENIDVESGQVTVSGSIITINPSVTLSSYTGYCVQIDATAFKDVAGNYYAGIADTTSWSFTTADMTPPTLVSATRTDDTHITVTLSKNSEEITKANDGGFTVTETGAPFTMYSVSATAQGIDARHVVLTVASIGKSAKEGVTVKYTAGDNGTVQDTLGNAMATNATGVPVAAWDTTGPTISSSTLAADNSYIDVVFSEGVYATADGTTELTAAKLALTFTQNGGTATNAVISSVRKNDNAAEGSASALTGGETTVRVFLNVTGTPKGLETIEIKPATGTSVYDLAGNAAAASQTSGVKNLEDKTNPTVSTLSPAHNASNINPSANLVITFSENVIKGTGSIVIKKSTGGSIVESIYVPGGQVTGGGTSAITIDPSATLDSCTSYHVLIDPTAFEDMSGNSYAGIADEYDWRFTTADATNPTVTALSPADNATDIGVNENLVITFSENVVVGTGNIVIRRTSNNRVIETIDVTSGQVTGDGTSTITIDPSVTLDNGTGYYVQIDATAFEDYSGNSYAGITNTTSWSFTTYGTLTSAPAINSIIAFCADSAGGFGTGDEIAIFFDQNTNKSAIVADAVYGTLKLNNEHSWGSVLTDEDFAWNTDGNMLIITFSNITGTTIAVGDEITLDETANIKAYDGTTPASTASGTITEDADVPIISSSAVAANNAYMDVVFSEGVYGAADGATPLTPDKLAFTFSQNGGTATNAVISSVKKNNSSIEGSASALTGGENTVRVFLTVAGTPNGLETIEIMPATDTSVYDWARNAVTASETSGAKTLHDLTAPLSTNADLSSLSLSGGTLSPAFDSATTAYTVNIPYATSSISVTPTTSNNSATVKVNNVPVTSGEASGAIALSVGSNTITIAVTAENTSVIKNYTLTVTRASAPTPTPDDDRDRSSDRTPAPSATATPVPAPVIVIINGVEQGAATAELKNVGGRIVNTIIIDDKKIEERLKAEGNNSKLIVPIKGDSDIKVAQLNGQSVKNMETKNSVLEIRTDNVIYTLPASQINIGKVSDSIGKQIELKDINVSIQISSPSQDTIKIIENTADKNSYQVVVKPVEFNIICTSGSKTVEVSKFNGYVERMVAIPEGIDPGKITTGVVLNSDGSFSHVPTTIIVIEGKYYAKINSLTNSTYSVISTSKTFKDIEKHWAKNAINTMASRLVMDGSSNDKFDPNASITRGELADAVVRGLGLLRSGATTDKFTDVKPGHKYMSAIATATEYGLIGGYVDNTYRPDNTITREEAMTILARAMKLAGMDLSITDAEAKEILSVYEDASKVNKTAANGAALCTRYGVFAGNNSILSPRGNITKAETAAVIKRLLEKAKLI